MADHRSSKGAAVVRELERELSRRVAGDVRFDDFTRVLYSTDASIYQMMPVGVVVPRGREDILATLEVVQQYGMPIVPRGAGTSQAGQAVNHAVVLDFTRYMDQVVEVNAEERWARVEPGIVIDHLNRKLRPLGLHFPIDPSTANRACVGGTIGNNGSGGHSLIYGITSDQVKELRVALSDANEATFGSVDGRTLGERFSGDDFEAHIYREVWRTAQENRDEIERRFPRIQRHVGGYALDALLGDGPVNMSRLVAGSEGTLCVITEARVNLEPLPKMKALAVAQFESLSQAMEATVPILEHGPSSVELMDGFLLEQCRRSPGFARRLYFLDGEPGSILNVEFYGESEEELRAKLERLRDDLSRRRLAYACTSVVDAAEQANVAVVRKASFGLLASVRGDAKAIPFVEDTAVAPEALSEYIRRFDQVVRDHGTTAGYYGHAGVGCLHIRPFVNLKTVDGVKQMVSIAEAIGDLVLLYGGALTGEHGDGIARGVWTEKMYGPRLYAAFQRVKRAFDPAGIMNPGKIVDCPPMGANLRFGPGYRTWEPDTILDFSRDHGYVGAAEMCSGVGACHKRGEGYMCPSFMATREEEHSTRGRANLLRAALSGLLPPEAFTSERMYEALELCLACKSCKSECPAGVDMAKLKYEFLANYYQVHGVPIRTRLFAHAADLCRLGCRLAPFSNWALRFPPLRLLMHVFPGIHRARRLPPFARPTFSRWFSKRKPQGDGHRGKVALFNDTFMNYNYPSIGKAAVEVLEKAGFEVVLAGNRCCGRPMISKGLLEEARELARYNVKALHRHVAQGIPIVGCEPSCLLTLRDEYPDLVPGEETAGVAQNSYLIEEFLLDLHRQEKLELEFNRLEKKVLFHGHCYQNALIGTGSALQVLRLPPGYQVEETNAGCCGMAGAFGYEKEHYEMSMEIGRQRLFPTIQAHPDWELVVMGVSCRQQVEHGTGRPARHLIQVLRDAL